MLVRESEGGLMCVTECMHVLVYVRMSPNMGDDGDRLD